MASLDPVTAKQIMDDLQRINQEMKITVLINIHHVELALQYASRVVEFVPARSSATDLPVRLTRRC